MRREDFSQPPETLDSLLKQMQFHLPTLIIYRKDVTSGLPQSRSREFRVAERFKRQTRSSPAN